MVISHCYVSSPEGISVGPSTLEASYGPKMVCCPLDCHVQPRVDGNGNGSRPWCPEPNPKHPKTKQNDPHDVGMGQNPGTVPSEPQVIAGIYGCSSHSKCIYRY